MWDRVIIHLDLDSFYSQVHRHIEPEIGDRPVVVQQHGHLLAACPTAKRYGASRKVSPAQALKLVPNLYIAHVPKVQGKVSLEIYRDASAEIFSVLRSVPAQLEKASIDEAYFDITSLVHERLEAGETPEWRGLVFGTDVEEEPPEPVSDFEVRLQMGSIIADEIRTRVKTELGYVMSVGIAHNKLLAKMGSAYNKPDGAAVITAALAADFVGSFKISKIPGLGRKLGARVMEAFGVATAADLQTVPQAALVEQFGESRGVWLFNRCRGRDFATVDDKGAPGSILASQAMSATTSVEKMRGVMDALILDLVPRVTKDMARYNRLPLTLTLNTGVNSGAVTRSTRFPQHGPDKALPELAHGLLTKTLEAVTGTFECHRLSLSVTRFSESSKQGKASISNFFGAAPPPTTTTTTTTTSNTAAATTTATASTASPTSAGIVGGEGKSALGSASGTTTTNTAAAAATTASASAMGAGSSSRGSVLQPIKSAAAQPTLDGLLARQQRSGRDERRSGGSSGRGSGGGGDSVRLKSENEAEYGVSGDSDGGAGGERKRRGQGKRGRSENEGDGNWNVAPGKEYADVAIDVEAFLALPPYMQTELRLALTPEQLAALPPVKGAATKPKKDITSFFGPRPKKQRTR